MLNSTKPDEIPVGNDGQFSTFVLIIQTKYPLSIMTMIEFKSSKKIYIYHFENSTTIANLLT